MKRSILVVCAGFLILGCDDPAEPQPIQSEASKPSINTGAAGGEPRFATSSEKAPAKLEYDYKIEPTGEKSTVTWTAKVPTGGWTMTTDQVLVEETMGSVWARIYVTIEAPNPSEMVTHGFQTLTGKHDADKKVDKVELSVRRKTQGDDPGLKPMYAVVKTDPR